MSTVDNNKQIDEMIQRIDRVVDAVIERGYDDIQEDYDDYSSLLETYEFRKEVTFQLYESYFPPKRHEFEIELLTTMVDALVASKTATFIGGAVIGGVVGNAAYDFMKKSLSYVKNKLKTIRRSSDSFKDIENNIDRIQKYFETHNQARTDEICTELDVEAHKIEPLLKLLGFRCLRRGKRNVWSKPV